MGRGPGAGGVEWQMGGHHAGTSLAAAGLPQQHTHARLVCVHRVAAAPAAARPALHTPAAHTHQPASMTVEPGLTCASSVRSVSGAKGLPLERTAPPTISSWQLPGEVGLGLAKRAKARSHARVAMWARMLPSRSCANWRRRPGRTHLCGRQHRQVVTLKRHVARRNWGRGREARRREYSGRAAHRCGARTTCTR